MKRQKIAIYIDYSIRIPLFKETYEKFKEVLFSNNLNIDKEGQDFWQSEIGNEEIFNFYVKTSIENIEDINLKGNYDVFFYNKDHLKRFLQEYSFNLFSDALVTNKRDIDLINISQSKLFDVTLIDVYYSSRKIQNTLYFLSVNRVTFRDLKFFHVDEIIDESEFFAIWNPVKNSNQSNNEKSDVFLNWLKELETKNKEQI